MKSLTKNIPIYLYAIALVAIVSLCFIIVQKSEIPVRAAENSPITDKADWENTSKETPYPAQSDVPLPASDTEAEKAVRLYSDSIPRSALRDERYAYAQTIYGNGQTELLDVFQTSVGVYVFLKTTSEQGDVCGTAPCVGIVKMDSYGNIQAAKSMLPAYADHYIAAAPTAIGLVLVTADRTDTYYYISILPYDLSPATPYRIPAAKGGQILQTATSFLFFASYETETIVYSHENGEIKFQSIRAGEITDLFEFSTYYIVYSSDLREHSYAISRFDKKTLALLSEKNVQDAQIKRVFPVFDNGSSSYILLEERNDCVYAVSSDNPMFSSVENAKKIGNFTLSQAYYDGKDILIVCKGNINGIIKLSADLTAKVSETNADYIPTSILDSYFSGSSLFYLTTDRNQSVTLVYTKNDSVFYRYFDFLTENAKIIMHIDGTLSLFYQDGDDVKIIGISADA